MWGYLIVLASFLSSTDALQTFLAQGDGLNTQVIKNSLYIQSGEVGISFWGMTSDHKHYMNNSSGARSYTQQVNFSEKFESNPQVVLSLKGYDASSDGVSSIRLIVNAVDITDVGFTLEVKTWADSKIHGVWVTWLAIGA